MGQESLLSGDPRGQITAPSACASSSFSTAPEGRSQGPSSRAPRATVGSERRHPGLVTDACRWATQVPRSVDTLLGPPTALAFEVPLEAKLYACSSPLLPGHSSAQLCHTSPQWVLSATALDGLQHDSDALLAPRPQQPLVSPSVTLALPHSPSFPRVPQQLLLFFVGTCSPHPRAEPQTDFFIFNVLF